MLLPHLLTVNSPLSPSITPLSFTLGSRPTSFTNLSHHRLLPVSGLTPHTLWLDRFFWASWFLFLVSFLFGSMRQIKLAVCQLLGTCKYSVSYHIVWQSQSSCCHSSAMPSRNWWTSSIFFHTHFLTSVPIFCHILCALFHIFTFSQGFHQIPTSMLNPVMGTTYLLTSQWRQTHTECHLLTVNNRDTEATRINSAEQLATVKLSSSSAILYWEAGWVTWVKVCVMFHAGFQQEANQVSDFFLLTTCWSRGNLTSSNILWFAKTSEVLVTLNTLRIYTGPN